MNSHDHLELLSHQRIFSSIAFSEGDPLAFPVTDTCLKRLREIVVPVSFASATALWL